MWPQNEREEEELSFRSQGLGPQDVQKVPQTEMSESIG